MDKTKMLEFIKAFAPNLLEGVDVATLSDQAIGESLAKAVEALVGKVKAEPCGEAAPMVQEHLGKALEAMKAGDMAAAMQHVQAAIGSLGECAGQYQAPAPASMTPAPAPAPAAPAPAAPAPVAASATPAVPTPAAPARESVDPNRVASLEDTVKKLSEENKARALRESQAVLSLKLSESGLPMAMRERMAKDLKGKVLTEAEIDAAVKEGKDFLAKLTEAGDIRGMGSVPGGISSGLTESDKIQLAVDLLVDPELARLKETKEKYAGIPRFRGLREAYAHITGDVGVRFSRRHSDKRMVEATLSTFPKVFGDSITRHMLRVYKGFPDYWRRAVTVRPVNDFRTQRAIQWGMFNDLAVVAENGAYTAFTNPTEREETYAPSKRGRSYQITREMILADDLRKLQQIGPGIARAAIRTLNQFVFNLLIGNSGGGGINTDVLADAAAIYTVGRANLGTAALDHDSLRAALIRLMKQKDENSVETLGLGVQTTPLLWVPLDLLPTSKVLVGSEQKPGSANNDINDNFKAAEPIGVPYLGGDANNWYLQAQQSELESIELGFVEGEEDPVLLYQDDPLVGDAFTNDRFTYKVRHEYGGVVTNPRGLDGSIVP